MPRIIVLARCVGSAKKKAERGGWGSPALRCPLAKAFLPGQPELFHFPLNEPIFKTTSYDSDAPCCCQALRRKLMVEQRNKEIASVTGIVFLLTNHFIRWVLLANIIAWPLAGVQVKVAFSQGAIYGNRA